MPNSPRAAVDTTIHQGLHLFDGTDFDTVVERVEYGGFGIIAFGPNRLDNGKMIAYKTLQRNLLNDPQTHASFVRECLLWVGLWGHPNVAVAFAVLQMGDAQGLRPFLALEFAENGSLRDLLRGATQKAADGRLPLALALDLAQQIAAGLAYLHQPDPAYLRTEPTVHRDLKPENVLLTGGWQAVITDFGLAKAVEASPTALALLLSQSGRAEQLVEVQRQGRQAEEAIVLGGEMVTQTTGLHTADGIALGTLPYMPPEQWEDARHVGPAADIYALGIMLSEIIAGRHALLDLHQAHSQAAWRRAHQQPQPRPLRERAPDVPANVEVIYRRCMAQDPEDRPTADEVLAALQEGARVAGVEVYTPQELIRHTPYNEWVHWHQWSNAYYRFEVYDKALACNDRALAAARPIMTDRPDALPAALMTRGNILSELGQHALSEGKTAEAAEWDRQAEAAFQESLMARAPATTEEGRRDRALVWRQIAIFNTKRRRYDYAEDAYARSIKLQPDMPIAYRNRAITQRLWGLEELAAGRREAGIAHLRQARVFAVTAIAMGHPSAATLLQTIEETLQKLGVSNQM